MFYFTNKVSFKIYYIKNWLERQKRRERETSVKSERQNRESNWVWADTIHQKARMFEIKSCFFTSTTLSPSAFIYGYEHDVERHEYFPTQPYRPKHAVKTSQTCLLKNWTASRSLVHICLDLNYFCKLGNYPRNDCWSRFTFNPDAIVRRSDWQLDNVMYTDFQRKRLESCVNVRLLRLVGDVRVPVDGKIITGKEILSTTLCDI